MNRIAIKLEVYDPDDLDDGHSYSMIFGEHEYSFMDDAIIKTMLYSILQEPEYKDVFDKLFGEQK